MRQNSAEKIPRQENGDLSLDVGLSLGKRIQYRWNG